MIPFALLTAPDRFRFEQDQAPFNATWVYDPADPLVIRLRFTADCVWEMARSLLADAFEVDYTGQGDVTLGVFGDDLVVSLSSPDGHATITGDARVAFEFLMDTYAACPPCEGVGHPGHVWCGECSAMGVIVDGALGRIEREAMS